MKPFLKLSITPLLFLALISCENIKKEKEPKVSNRVINQSNRNFSFHQDTLYFGTQKYNGFVISQFPNGDTATFIGYLEGLEHGIAKKWYPNKQIAEIRFYKKGKKAGIHKGYWENAKPKFEYHFLEGEHHGLAKEWYEGGQIFKEFHYKMGYEDGSQKAWWENGKIRANYVVKNNRRYGLIGLKLCMNPNDKL